MRPKSWKSHIVNKDQKDEELLPLQHNNSQMSSYGACLRTRNRTNNFVKHRVKYSKSFQFTTSQFTILANSRFHIYIYIIRKLGVVRPHTYFQFADFQFTENSWSQKSQIGRSYYVTTNYYLFCSWYKKPQNLNLLQVKKNRFIHEKKTKNEDT